jgi:hypothetical protein
MTGMDTPDQKQERKMMESKTLEMTITDDGYRYVAGMLVVNVLENVKTRKDWSMEDASFLIMGALRIARNLSDDEFNLLISTLEGRYSGK